MQFSDLTITSSAINKATCSALFFMLLLLSKTASSDYPIAPEFTLPTQDTPIQLSKLQGKLVYVDFWASWCRPCKTSFPWMISMKEKFKDMPFEIVAINLDKDKTLADEFIKSQAINFPIAFNPDANVAEEYGVEGMPSSYLVDSQGRLRIRYTGFWNKSKDEKEHMIKTLLQQMKNSPNQTASQTANQTNLVED